jgi:DnaJ-class molecular chaperone
MTRNEYIQCPECDGHGAFSNNGNDPWAKSTECAACHGTGERENGQRDWDAAMALFRSFADPEEGFGAVEARYDGDLAQYINDAALVLP